MAEEALPLVLVEDKLDDEVLPSDEPPRFEGWDELEVEGFFEVLDFSV